LRLVWKAAGVHEHEAAGAVGVLGHAGAEAGLAEQRALLVARHAADADGAAQQIGGVSPKWLPRAAPRAAAPGDAQQRQQLVVPLVGVHVEQHGALALLTSVTCTAPPVSCHISQLSTVPKASSPRSAAARAPGTWSSSHCSLVPEK
jgi:hypothetical protein